MNKINYDKEMQKVIKEIKKGEKPKLLLHACCAPCSTACIERVKDVFDVTVWFYNPNMDTLYEYNKRAEEMKRFAEISGVKCIVSDFCQQDYFAVVKGLENEPEGGKRCLECFKLRLNRASLFAKENGFDYFTTTLTLSPLKDSEVLNKIGEEEGTKTGIKFLPSDFKKRGGYLRSIQLSNEYGLYRQNYCGCVFSRREIPNL